MRTVDALREAADEESLHTAAQEVRRALERAARPLGLHRLPGETEHYAVLDLDLREPHAVAEVPVQPRRSFE